MVFAVPYLPLLGPEFLPMVQDERTATQKPGNPLDQLTYLVDSMSHIVRAFHSTYVSWLFLNGGEGGAFIIGR